MFRKTLIAGAILAGATSTVMAAPFMAMDPRSMGMGGTGVASSTSNNASLYNPALLSVAAEDEDFSWQLLSLAARVADPDDFQKAVSDFNDNKYYDNYQVALDALILDPLNATKLNTFQAATADLNNGLLSLSGKDIEADIAANTIIAIPSRSFAMAFTAGGWVSSGFQGEYTQQDSAKLSNTLSDIANSIFDPTNPVVTSALDPATLTSNVKVRGILAQEIGLSFAREFNVFGQDIAFGLTPKFVNVKTYDTVLMANQVDIDLAQGEKDGSGFTMDFGMARDYGNYWKTGFVVKNLIPQSYDTAIPGNKIDVNPMARVGISRNTDRTAIALDVDLTENDATSFGNKTQYVSLGGEIDLWLLELRAGYRHNIPDAKTSVATAGVGLYLFGVNLDVAGAVSPSGNEYGVSAQLGFSF